MEIKVSKVVFSDSIKELDKKSKEIMEKQIFKVGDRVYSINGWGTVIETQYNTSKYPVNVKFDSGETDQYTCDGKFYDCEVFPTLSFTEYTLQGFSQERPIELPEVGELCLVRDNKGAVWHVRHFEEYIPGEALCFKTDSGYWGEMKRIKILD